MDTLYGDTVYLARKRVYKRYSTKVHKCVTIFAGWGYNEGKKLGLTTCNVKAEMQLSTGQGECSYA
jgi:hypothetical protein